MKKLTLAILLVSAISLTYFAQDQTKVKSVQSAIDNLFETCKNDNYEAAASKFAYDEKGTARFLKDAFNYSDQKEAAKVKRIAKKIKAFLNISDSHEFGKFEVLNSEGTEYLIIEVLFNSGKQQLKTKFTFVESGSKLLLADVD